MNCVATQQSSLRHWLASIQLRLQQRAGSTRVVSSRHQGPLRVQRPFYPERSDCCHVYLLHPPGGMVIGDELTISAELDSNASGLITTPSAGKVYGAKGAAFSQRQTIEFHLAESSTLEWLPQETIVFNTANAELKTRINLAAGARYFGWDIVRLGRIASGETFQQGYCEQRLEVYFDNKPLLIERNRVVAGEPLQSGVYGLQGRNTFATLVATCQPGRDAIDKLCETLDGMSPGADCWGLTQKGSLFIARYLGDDVALCRRGFEYIWRYLRPLFNGNEAVPPRIWRT
ncbi:urease accessory protein UreD [Teredinibacter turnerae]|uniref:urease accessory protein UreD n=1 Tax=Teredinibacter turnerae TaxID=2426 RepID=UPI0030D11A19